MSRLLTWVLRLLPLLGVLLTAAGLGVFGAVPAAGWDTGGFIVNLVSSLTAACFGIPLAFFVLQKLLQDREEERRKANIVIDAAQAIGRLETEFVGRCTLGMGSAADVRRYSDLALDGAQLLESTLTDDGGGEADRVAEAGSNAASLVAPLGRIDFRRDLGPIEICRTTVRFIIEDINATILREGWPPLNASVLRSIEEYLDWYTVLAKEHYSGKTSFAIIDKFVMSTWPIILEKLDGDETLLEERELSGDDQQSVQVAIEALEDAQDDLNRVHNVLSDMLILGDQAKRLARRED